MMKGFCSSFILDAEMLSVLKLDGRMKSLPIFPEMPLVNGLPQKCSNTISPIKRMGFRGNDSKNPGNDSRVFIPVPQKSKLIKLS
jgi:hypothetical protein